MTVRGRIVALASVGSVLLAGSILAGTAAAGTDQVATGDPGGQADYAAAAREFRVPEPVLLAYSYALTGWDDHGGAPSADGGYGPMHLTAPDGVRGAGRGGTVPDRTRELRDDPTRTTLARAAGLLRLPADRLKTDPTQNIRGGAALLADEARRVRGGAPPASLGDWYPVIAGTATSSAFADDVFEHLRAGADRLTRSSRHIRLVADPSVAGHRDAAAATAAGTPECPSGLNCRFIPAAYAWNNTANPNAYGNYDPANRPRDGNPVRYIVLHDTEGSYDGTVSWFQDPHAYTSAHYVVRSSDGAVTQMVRTRDIAWHAGAWNVNTESIGIEQEGVAVDGATWYTDALYRSSAALVRYLAHRYHIPLDREHIVGHEDIANDSNYADSHWDPGPFWDWDRFMRMVGAPIADRSAPAAAGRLVTIKPDFATNRPPLHYCPGGPSSCRDVPPQPTNFVFLRTEPRADAPLLSDPYLNNGGPGTDDIADWSDKAVTGRRYVLAERRGDWAGIWYGGKVGWLHDPGGVNTRPTAGIAVRPRAGRSTIPAYALAFPEPGEYPAGVPAESPPRDLVPLYQVPAGQRYALVDLHPATNYYARFDGANVPHNHTIIRGRETYLLVSFNHRYLFVRASDVEPC